ncbi:Fibronectin type III, partial [Trinorchestia longiramus]
VRVCAENAAGLSDPSPLSELVTVALDSEATEPHFLRELRNVTAVLGNRVSTSALVNSVEAWSSGGVAGVWSSGGIAGVWSSEVEFTVAVVGSPPPDVTWYKDGFEIYDTKRFEFYHSPGDHFTLALKEVRLTDEGDIRVRATNRAGAASSQAILKVQAPPNITLPPQYEQGLIFDTDELIRLRVPYFGRPQPTASWSHNGKQIKIADRFSSDVSEKFVTLKIGSGCRADMGMYQLLLENPHGSAQASFFITVTDRPEPPSRPMLAELAGNSITLRWDAPPDDGGCRVNAYILEYFRVGWDVWLKAMSSRITWAQLNDLIVGSDYKFRVKAENAYGVSDASPESDVIHIEESRTPGSSSFEYDTYKSTSVAGSSLPQDRATAFLRGESSTSGGSSDTGSFDKARMTERKRMALEPDSVEEQEFRKSFEVEYNRSFEVTSQNSFGGDAELPTLKLIPPLQKGQISSDVDSQSSFDTELPTLREQDRPSFDLPEEDSFLLERQKFYEQQAAALQTASSTESDVPAPPKRAPRKGRSPVMPPTMAEFSLLVAISLESDGEFQPFPTPPPRLKRSGSRASTTSEISFIGGEGEPQPLPTPPPRLKRTGSRASTISETSLRAIEETEGKGRSPLAPPRYKRPSSRTSSRSDLNLG